MELENLEKELNIKFKDKNLLLQAFTHRSYLNEHPDFKVGQNERLEYLGDAVIELVVTEYLFKTYPEKPEGDLTNYRAALVNAEMLSKIAKNLNFNSYLLLSKGESKDIGKARDFILANTFEAFLGALYLDKNYKEAEKFLHKILLPNIKDIIEKKLWKDPKSLFQEKAQEEENVTPSYKVLKEEGPDHAKIFIVGVFLSNVLITKGEGSSKQEAELDAASKGLKEKHWH